MATKTERLRALLDGLYQERINLLLQLEGMSAFNSGVPSFLGLEQVQRVIEMTKEALAQEEHQHTD